MTVLDHRSRPVQPGRPARSPGARRAQPVRVGPRNAAGPQQRRPGPARPAVAPLRYRGTGLVTARGPHRQRAVSPATTVVLALLAALITVWLGIVAQLGAAVTAQAEAVPTDLAVVRIEAGETLQHLAERVAPGAPTHRVVAAIRELNGLDSVALEAGQTLIAPVG